MKCAHRGAAEWLKKNPEKRAAREARHRARVYGLTPAQRDALLRQQKGCCAICGTSAPGGKGQWHFDHDHRFAKTDPRSHRGLLCNNCNLGLGRFLDRPDLLRAAAEYVERFAQ